MRGHRLLGLDSLTDELDVLLVEVLLLLDDSDVIVVAGLFPTVDEVVGEQEGAISALHCLPAVSEVGEDGHYDHAEGAEDEEELEHVGEHGVSFRDVGVIIGRVFHAT